jgi:hypothetical protein
MQNNKNEEGNATPTYEGPGISESPQWKCKFVTPAKTNKRRQLMDQLIQNAREHQEAKEKSLPLLVTQSPGLYFKADRALNSYYSTLDEAYIRFVDEIGLSPLHIEMHVYNKIRSCKPVDEGRKPARLNEV